MASNGLREWNTQVVAQNRRDSGQIQCLKLSNLPIIATRNWTHSSWFSTPPIATNCWSRKTNVSRTSTVPGNFDESLSRFPQHSHCCHSCSGTSHITTIMAQQHCKKKIEWRVWRLSNLRPHPRFPNQDPFQPPVPPCSYQTQTATDTSDKCFQIPTNTSTKPNPNLVSLQFDMSTPNGPLQAERMNGKSISSHGLVRAPKLASESRQMNCMLSVAMVILEDDRKGFGWMEAQGSKEEDRDSWSNWRRQFTGMEVAIGKVAPADFFLTLIIKELKLVLSTIGW